MTSHTRKLFSRQQRILGKLNGQIEETISGENIVKAFCREEDVIAQFEESNVELCKTATRALIWSGYLMLLTNVINNLSYVGISIVSGVMAVNGNLSIGKRTDRRERKSCRTDGAEWEIRFHVQDADGIKNSCTQDKSVLL